MSLYNKSMLYSMMDLNNLEVQNFKWGKVTWIHEPLNSQRDQISLAIVRIFPNERQEEHLHLGEEQMWHVLQGEGIHLIDGETMDIKESEIIYCPPYTNHELINTGSKDLIVSIVYVPIKLSRQDHGQMIVSNKNLRDILNGEIIYNIEQELIEILKLPVSIYDREHKEIIEKNVGNKFCEICKTINTCNKERLISDHFRNFSDRIYKCKYGLTEMELPITFNNETLGYINCKGFIIHDLENKDKELSQLSEEIGMELEDLRLIYAESESLLRNRIYIIEETLAVGVQFIQEIIERTFFESELRIKEAEILRNTKERIELKDALQKVNYLLLNKNMFIGSKNYTNRKEVYPFIMEEELGGAIRTLNSDKVSEIISMNQHKYENSKGIVEEMITVLLRTGLNDISNMEIKINLRKKYDEILSTSEDRESWKILNKFCLESIDYLSIIFQDNRKELIENVNEYIRLNFREDITLGHISEVFYVSPNYLSSLFNEKNKRSLSNYIQFLRVEEAKKYLRNTDLKIKDISKKIGCNNVSYFVTIFRKMESMTPTEYRLDKTAE